MRAKSHKEVYLRRLVIYVHPLFILKICDFYTLKLGKSRVQPILLIDVQVARTGNGLNWLRTKSSGIIRYYQWC
jgi:hypothetical protein